PSPLTSSFFFYSHSTHHNLHSFPTRRSSDLSIRTEHQAAQQHPGLRRSIRSTRTVRHCSPLASKDDRRDHEDLHQPAYECWGPRSEEHTSELQSRFDLVCRLLLEKKK